MYSDDDGDSWSYGGMFLKGYQGYAPYFKYATDSLDTIQFAPNTIDGTINVPNGITLSAPTKLP